MMIFNFSTFNYLISLQKEIKNNYFSSNSFESFSLELILSKI